MIVAIIYVYSHCPICQSLLKSTLWRGATSRRCIPIIFRDIEHVPLHEKLMVYPYTMDPIYGLTKRFVTPYLVIAEISSSGQIEKIYFRKPLMPTNPPVFTEPEIREIIYTTHAWCRHGVSETDATVGVAKGGRRKRKAKSGRGKEVV